MRECLWLRFLLCSLRPYRSCHIVDAKNYDSETTIDSENFVENLVVAGIQANSDITIMVENCFENFVDSLRQLLLQLCPLALVDTYQLDGQSSVKCHTMFSQIRFLSLSSVLKLLSSVQKIGFQEHVN